MAPRPTQDRKDTAPSTKGGLEEVVHSVKDVSLVDSPVEEVESPMEGTVDSPEEDAHASHDSINPPIASPSAGDPRQGSASSNPVAKSDSAIPALEVQRSTSPEQKQIYDVISTSPAASACETPCIDMEAHKAGHGHHGIPRDGFFPVQEDAHEDDLQEEEIVAESPGGLSDEGDVFSAIRNRKDGSTDVSPLTTQQKALREEEQAHVDSMAVAKDAALSHSAQALHASRKRSEGFSPPAPASAAETPRDGALTPAGPRRGKERMLSVDDGMSDASSVGRGQPGSHRRTSSTHR